VSIAPVTLKGIGGKKEIGEKRERRGEGATNKGLQSGEDTRSLQKGEDKSLWAGAFKTVTTNIS